MNDTRPGYASVKTASPLLQELSTSGEIRQGRFALYATWLSLGLILAVFVLSVLYMSRLYRASELQAVSQSAVLMAETADARLSSTREAVSRFAYGIRPDNQGADKAQSRARHLMSAREEVTEISLLDSRGKSLQSFASGLAVEPIALPQGSALASEDSRRTLELARKSDTALFSSPYFIQGNSAPYIDLIVPVSSGRFVIARISLSTFLKLIIPSALPDRAHLSLEMNGKSIYAPAAPAASTQAGFHLQLPPLPPSVRVLISPYERPLLFAKDLSTLTILGLGITLLASVLGLVVFQLRQRQTSMRLLTESVVRQAMSESIASGLKVTDMEGRVAYVNRAYNALFQLDSGSIIGQRIPPELPSGQPPGKRARTETKMTRSDGSAFDALLEITPLTDQAGKQIGWMEMISDITEDKRIERELAQNRDRITKVLDSIDSAVSVLGVREGTPVLLYANPTYCRLFGADPAVHEALMPPAGQRDALPAGSSATQLEHGGRWFDVRERELIWTDGMAASLQIATDITEQRRNEELMAQQEKKAELSSRLVTMGEMASSLAHELNQPLGAIANYASAALTLLQSGKLAPENSVTAFEKISHQAERAATIIRRIRSFAKRTAPEMVRVPVSRLIEETMELALIQAKKRQARIVQNVQEGLPDIICDAVMVEQLLLNLLKNAMEAAAPCPDHTVTLSVSAADSRSVVFEVADRGPGIPDAVKEKLFEPFFSTKSDGMGIGLNICRSIAEMHRGRLRAEDNPGGGTVFRLTLPVDGS